jgi:4'-phosphopantetheinyl transferase
MAACAVSWQWDLGIDVENMERAADEEPLASQSFSRREREFLAQSPVELRRRRFFDLWTLKEAYIKARGEGLSIPLDSFSIILQESQPPRIELEEVLTAEATPWQFYQWRVADRYVVSLALRADTPETPVLNTFCPGQNCQA